MVKIKLELPDDIITALKLPPEETEVEIRKELALSLYKRGALSVGKAKKLAGMNIWEFDKLLGERQIKRHYTNEDLKEDIKYAQSSK